MDKKKNFSMNKKDKNKKGGMSDAGIKRYNKETGSNLKKGVKGAADTPEKMKRKGSFLTRHYKGEHNQSHPLTDSKGRPTRKALASTAWGEPIPKTKADMQKLAKKGERLLARYEKTKQAKKNDRKKK